jgi:hypothetical protein
VYVVTKVSEEVEMEATPRSVSHFVTVIIIPPLDHLASHIEDMMFEAESTSETSANCQTTRHSTTEGSSRHLDPVEASHFVPLSSAVILFSHPRLFFSCRHMLPSLQIRMSYICLICPIFCRLIFKHLIFTDNHVTNFRRMY